LKVVLKRQRVEVMHVIPGGSENKLLKNILANPTFPSGVVSLNRSDHDMEEWCKKNQLLYFNLSIHSKNLVLNSLKMLRLILLIRPKVIFFHGFIPSLIGAIVYPVCGISIKIVPVRHHNLVHHLQRHRNAIYADKFINKLSSHIVAVSDSVKQAMIDEGCDPKKVTVVTNAMSFENKIWKSTKRKVAESPRLLAIGRIDWQKNYFSLLNMIAIFKHDYPAVKLTILGAGDKNLLIQLEQHCLMLNITKNVEWAGWDAATFERFSESDILVHAAVDEACPLVLIEGLILGIPIASTQEGGSKDVLKNYYLPFNTEDPVAFSNRISSLIKNWENSISYAASISNTAKEEFNILTLGQRYEDVVSNLIYGASHEN